MAFNQVYGNKRDFSINHKKFTGDLKPNKVSQITHSQTNLAGKGNRFGNRHA